MDTDLRKQVRHSLVEADITLARVVRSTPDLDYMRVERVLNGRASPRPGEIASILYAIKRVTGRDGGACHV